MNYVSRSMCVRPPHTFLAAAWRRGPRPSVADLISTVDTARVVRLRELLGGIGAGIPRAATLLVVLAVASHAATPAQFCQSEKNKLAGAYAECRQKVEAKFAVTGDDAARTRALQTCLVKFNTKWPVVESRAGGECPSENDQGAIQGVTDTHTTNVAIALSGGPLSDCPSELTTCTDHLARCTANVSVLINDYILPCQTALEAARACGNGAIDGTEACDVGNLNGQTCATQGFAGGTLGCGPGCTFDTTDCWASRFVDNGDGTVTDRLFNLQWEKKTDDGSVHDKDNRYSWSTGGGAMPNGTAFTTFLGTLNGAPAITRCFAGHCDWRLPTSEELQTIVDRSVPGCANGSPSQPGTGPCIDQTVFGPTGAPRGRITPIADGYWSATSVLSSPVIAYYVRFHGGFLLSANKGDGTYVRAVRSGL